MRGIVSIAAVLLFSAGLAQAASTSAVCEGVCDDGAGNVMTSQSRCEKKTQECHSGCSITDKGPRPYADCVGHGEVSAAEQLPRFAPPSPVHR